MSDKDGLVNFQEDISIKVGRFIRKKGFDLAANNGIRLRFLAKRVSFGILYKDENAKPREHLFGLIKRKPLRLFLGTLWLTADTDSGDQTTPQKWRFRVYGREYVELTKQLAEGMAAEFGVNIEVCLVQDEPNVEQFHC